MLTGDRKRFRQRPDSQLLARRAYQAYLTGADALIDTELVLVSSDSASLLGNLGGYIDAKGSLRRRTRPGTNSVRREEPLVGTCCTRRPANWLTVNRWGG
jgi:hypothetical protein